MLQLQFARGAHIGHLFETPEEQKAFMLMFLKEGLRLGEQCTYVTADDSVDDWLFELQSAGMDVGTELQQGALKLIGVSEWLLPDDFDSVAMARRAWRTITGSLANFPAVRLLEDKGATLATSLSIDRLTHWEATAGVLYENTSVCAICQYDLKQHSPAAIHAALRTHSHLILSGRMLLNPFYEGREILANEPGLNESAANADQVEKMLTRLRASV